MTSQPSYPKRLIEVDLPIARISAHARREKSIRHGHISTLHIWWARRPLAACRAGICAALWPDPGDMNCPVSFRHAVADSLAEFSRRVLTERATFENCSKLSERRWRAIRKLKIALDPSRPRHNLFLRKALLDFIADFANWDNSTVPVYLETARGLTQAAHEALGGEPATRPLVVDPFAGGGSIPLEALRVGADAFASDLNPVPVMLNKIILEYIPQFGQTLADEVRVWGARIMEEAERELKDFYPGDVDGAAAVAYLWARTVLSEAPGEELPVEVPLLRSFWLCKKPNRKVALRWVRDPSGAVRSETVELSFADGITRKVRRPLLEIFEPTKLSEVSPPTVARGSATCPLTGYTTPVAKVRSQLKSRHGGASDSRMLCVVTTRVGESGRKYRLPTALDLDAAEKASRELENRVAAWQGPLSFVPDEPISLNEIRRISVPIYGMTRWGNLHTRRQCLGLAVLSNLIGHLGDRHDAARYGDLTVAVQTCLAVALDKLVDFGTSLCRWGSDDQGVAGTFGRQALGMVWDFAEASFLQDRTGGFSWAYEFVAEVIEGLTRVRGHGGHAELASASAHPLPNDSADAVFTDPPYYDAVPYAHLSDLFYVWLRRSLWGLHRHLLNGELVDKQYEIVVDRPHELSTSTKDVAFYERELTNAFIDCRRVVRPSGIATIIFASKTTSSWEALLAAVVNSGWAITASWPVDTEMGYRLAAQGQSRLASSVHIVCRPRENADGTLSDAVGEWRDVLGELPNRIHEWMPRLSQEGVVGADAIFACLGPALEIFSRYSRVEKANGEPATLREYLEHVWAAVSTEALSLIFRDADATGLEPDARLTAMWLWTLGGGKDSGNGKPTAADVTEEADGDDAELGAKPPKVAGYALEFDAARKIAQGLGVHLEKSESIVEIRGETARLVPVAERTGYLFGKDASTGAPASGRRSKKPKQRKLFEELDEAEAAEAGWTELKGPPPGSTVLDRLHQSMILFAAGRGELMKRFLVDDGVGRDARFWKLAQSLAALYPQGTDERRWVEGVLARKKGLGL